MVLGSKRIFLYAVLSVVLVGSTTYLLFPPQLKLFYVIDSDYLSEVEPHGTWSNTTCPQCGSQLKRIVLDPDNPQIMDDARMFAYYCRKEDMFWIADTPGFDFAEWYGPFDANLRLTNTVAMCLVIISSIALGLLAIKDKGQIKK